MEYRIEAFDTSGAAVTLCERAGLVEALHHLTALADDAAQDDAGPRSLRLWHVPSLTCLAAWHRDAG